MGVYFRSVEHPEALVTLPHCISCFDLQASSKARKIAKIGK